MAGGGTCTPKQSKIHVWICKPIVCRHCVSVHHFLLEVKLDNDIPTNSTRLSVVSVIDVVRGGGTVCTFERKQLRRAEQLKGTAPAAAFLKWRDGSRPSDLLATGWSLVKSTTGKVWNCVEVGDCVNCQLLSLSKDLVRHCEKGTEAMWTLCCHLHCRHVFSSLFLCLKMLRNFPEANMGVSPMKRREASEVKVRRVTTGRAKRAFRQILIFQYNIINRCNYNWRWGVSQAEQDMGSSTSPWLICGNGEWV